MNSCSKNELRRCRPLLGTLVEVTASGKCAQVLNAAIEAAFAAIQIVEQRMSVHDDDSELSAVNRDAHRHPVRLSEQTCSVLAKGLRLARQTAGAFDFTIAPTLAQWGLLPKHLRRRRAGDWRNVKLLPGRRVFFLRPLAIDLGGIAKGYAVDMAIDVLRRAGVPSGVVNAGGDMRAYGGESVVVHLRHPVEPQALVHPLTICDVALATSSPCFTQRPWRGRTVSHLVAPGRNRAVTGCVSASVLARECWLADALTKVVLNAPEQAEQWLAAHHARACVLAA